MSFVHEDPEFADLILRVADDRRLAPGLIEKDYWVTHTLWALHQTGFEIWFKGGTSLSKGYDIIHRFSEDLDLKIDPGSTGLTRVSNWRSEGPRATEERRTCFGELTRRISVPGAAAALAPPDEQDRSWRNARVRVTYPGHNVARLPTTASPFVLLEIGSARVTPFVSRESMTSFVHDELNARGVLSSYSDNRPRTVRCVHPLVTLLDKLDALRRKALNEEVEPAAFVRHFEDVAHIIRQEASLPPLADYANAYDLAHDMRDDGDIEEFPSSSHPAFLPASGPRWDAIRRAHEAIADMFWGPRIPLETACAEIRKWVKVFFE